MIERPMEPCCTNENAEQWAAIAEWESERADRLREALEWYANKANYFPRHVLLHVLDSGDDIAPVYGDLGRRAQAAIGKEIDDMTGHKEAKELARAALQEAER